jgi:hypothetical protein
VSEPHFLEVEREMIRDQILFPSLRDFGGCLDSTRGVRAHDCERGNCACAQLADRLIHDISFWTPGSACAHEFVDARNAYVVSGEVCLKCGAIRAGNENSK